MNLPTLVKKPSAFLPLVMSSVALAVLVGHLLLFGAARETDEGAAAHLFQLLVVAQVPIVAFFAIRWLPRASKPALGVLALQAGAILVALVPVWYFNL